MKRLAVRISATLGEKLPNPGRKMSQPQALKSIVHKLWPTHTRSSVGREFDLTDHEARMVCEGRASINTITKILHHPRGEFAVGVRLLELMLGKEMGPALEAQREAEEHAALLAEQARQARLRRLSEAVSATGAPKALAEASA